MTEYEQLREGEKGAWVSIVAYIVLSIIKLSIGWLSNSEALFADGFNNSTDIMASLAILIGLKISRRPPDDDHFYGHFRAETVAALIASLIMVAVGLEVLYQAVSHFFIDAKPTPDLIAAWTALGCALIMLIVYRYNYQLANRLNSKALIAAAKDNLSDTFVSVGAFIGIFGSQFGMPLLDPIVAIIVSFFILKTGWSIFKDATHSLTDGFDLSLIKAFEETVIQIPGVEEVKDIRARFQGNQVLVDLTVYVMADLNVTESHAISDAIETHLQQEHQVKHVHVHIEPFKCKGLKEPKFIS
ncbi:MAG: cation transporter [Gorillibacterium sp.]|nr:cation transporter [Gorillibacterium sp.]